MEKASNISSTELSLLQGLGKYYLKKVKKKINLHLSCNNEKRFFLNVSKFLNKSIKTEILISAWHETSKYRNYTPPQRFSALKNS